ncbi:hypothetical protein O7605_20885 [Verrucosispora sp. WMMA2121]|uniref:hypothetical protein n=1 Tax=Verrucosispora sp. WMMA2121 TaxID=3015164 RepID=UPI0022B6B2D2|nr:hypothetical protein [Verrucosispora sp. WMMA2121]MCZ7421958.1 hypothetical protein [Verrucosispora sp. WMMA2121]
MSTDRQVDWAKLAPQLADAARRDRAWYLMTARELVAPGDRLAVDIGCGGMARMMTCGRVVAVDAHPAVVDAACDHMFRLSARSVRCDAGPQHLVLQGHEGPYGPFRLHLEHCHVCPQDGNFASISDDLPQL